MFRSIIDLLKTEKRPYLSTILWFFSGVIEIICLISSFAPFGISWDFIDEISVTKDISKINLIHLVAFISVIVCAITWCVRWITIRAFQHSSEETIRTVYVIIFTIYDVVDLFSSIITTLFMFFVFTVQYQTGAISYMGYDPITYLYVAIRFTSFIADRFRAKNLEIVNNAFKKYPEVKDN